MESSGSGRKCLVITGGSRGIGLAAARRFQDAGHRVVNLSRSPSPIPDVVQIKVDLAEQNWADAAAEPLTDAVRDMECIALVHNSALQVPGAITEMSAPKFRAMLEVSVVGPAILNRLLLPHMRPGSAILYVGSTLSLRATPHMAAYVTCKHAVVGLMRSTCQDLAETGVHTSCVCPGFTDTEMLQSYGGDAMGRLAALSTQKRLIAPREVAEAIYFAATNPVVNGSVLSADLGFVEP